MENQPKNINRNELNLNRVIIDRLTGNPIAYRDDSDAGAIGDLMDLDELIENPENGEQQQRYKVVAIDRLTGKPYAQE